VPPPLFLATQLHTCLLGDQFLMAGDMDPSQHQNGFISRSRRQDCDQFLLFYHVCSQFCEFVAMGEKKKNEHLGRSSSTCAHGVGP
jgi:hypothetical protein